MVRTYAGSTIIFFNIFCPIHVWQEAGKHEGASDQESDKEAGDGSEDEEGAGRVGFVSFDLAEEKPDNTEFRLQRKDTPHFTKGKRIVQGDEQKAREILANLGAKEDSEENESDVEGKEPKEVDINFD